MNWTETVSVSKTVDIRSAQNELEVDAAYDMASKVFGPNYFAARQNHVRMQQLERLRDLRDVIVAVHQSNIVGLVRIVDREIWLGEATLKVGGVTSVCVHPDVQGQGYGRAIMEEALARLRQRADVLSIAFARRAVDGFYPKLGYVGLGCHPELRAGLGRSQTSEHKTLHLSAGLDEQWLSRYASAYEASYRAVFLSFRRGDEWWRSLSLRLSPLSSRGSFIAVSEGNAPIGYLILHEGRVIETACLAGFEEVVVEAMLAVATQQGDELVLALPLSHWAMQWFQSRNHTLKVRYSWDGGHMVRVLDGVSFGKALTGVLDSVQRQPETIANELQRCDVRRHEEAHALLLRLAGAAQTSPCDRRSGQGWQPTRPSRSWLPTWSLLDEF